MRYAFIAIGILIVLTLHACDLGDPMLDPAFNGPIFTFVDSVDQHRAGNTYELLSTAVRVNVDRQQLEQAISTGNLDRAVALINRAHASASWLKTRTGSVKTKDGRDLQFVLTRDDKKWLIVDVAFVH